MKGYGAGAGGGVVSACAADRYGSPDDSFSELRKRGPSRFVGGVVIWVINIGIFNIDAKTVRR